MKEKLPMIEVLAWLHTNYPELHAAAETERDWLWLCHDLRGEHNKPLRDSLCEFGFRFAKHGHTLPSGQVSFWSHSCTKPTPFKRRGKSTSKPTANKNSGNNVAPFSSDELAVASALFA